MVLQITKQKIEYFSVDFTHTIEALRADAEGCLRAHEGCLDYAYELSHSLFLSLLVNTEHTGAEASQVYL